MPSKIYTVFNSTMFNSIKTPEILGTEDFEFSEVDTSFSGSPDSKIKKVLKTSSNIVLLGCVLVMPFLFGAVHELSYLSFRILIFSLVCCLLVFDYSSTSRIFSLQKAQGKIFLALSSLLLLLVGHAVLFYYLQSNHPVIGATNKLLNIETTLNIILEYASFLSLYFITLYRLEICSSNSKEKQYSYLQGLILVSALLVSLTALSHWFYDNGKLFWIFSANFEGTSSRARWPFVNSNHLGIYLMIPIFTAIGGIQIALYELKHSISKLSRRGKIILSDALTDISTQKILRSFILQCLLVLTFGLAIIASLSRNAMSSSVLCLALLLLFPANKKPKVYAIKNKDNFSEVVEESLTVSESGNRIRKRSKRSTSPRSLNSPGGIDISKAIPTLKFLWRCCLFFGTIAIFWFFLGDKGGDLFKARLEYALLYTQDDMRWQLYKDSVAMISLHPFIGIGLGNWAAIYPSYMAEGLSGMLPGYLHSDLLQLAIEIGLCGFTVFLLVFVFNSWQIFRNKSQSNSDSTVMVAKNIQSRAVYFGMLALILSASFEFPFRIPAIVALFAVALALQAHSKET